MTDKGAVHLVYAECGEYSDRDEWVVAAFSEEDKAEAFAALCRRKHAEAAAAYRTASDATWALREASTHALPLPDAKDFSFPEDPNARVGRDDYGAAAVPLNPAFLAWGEEGAP